MEKVEKNKAKNEIKFKYALKDRIIIALLSSFTFSFIYFIFGPIDIFKNNFDEYLFSLGDFIVPLLVIFLLSFIILFLIIVFRKGPGVNVATSIILTFIVYRIYWCTFYK